MNPLMEIKFFEIGEKEKRLLFRLAVERDDMEKQILDGENQMRSDFLNYPVLI